jgi:hypothetical protein
MRLIVAGGRDYCNRLHIQSAMLFCFAEYGAPDWIITGRAPGVDTIADDIAEALGLDRVNFPANWVGRKRGAGYIRNWNMAHRFEATHLLTMPGGRGTANMHEVGTKAGLVIIDRRYDIRNKPRRAT